MWIVRCVQACRGAVAVHPLAIGVPAAVTTVGAATALAVMLAAPPPKPQLPCGCHQVWVAPVLPMTPATYNKVMNAAGAIALAGIPLANAPGGEVFAPPANALPAAFLRPDVLQPPLPTGSVPGSPVGPAPVPVPEPASATLFAGALAALAVVRWRGVARRR
jgi:hypothetical protein